MSHEFSKNETNNYKLHKMKRHMQARYVTRVTLRLTSVLFRHVFKEKKGDFGLYYG